MFIPPPFVPTVDPSPSGITCFHPLARPLFERALWQGKFRGAVAHLMNRSRQLYTLDGAADHLPHSIASHDDVQEIPLAQIKGSVNRCCEFDCEFYPLCEQLEERWVRVGSMTLQGHAIPPVELIKSGDIYYVVDGHHRVSVARALHYLTVEAVVVGVYEDTLLHLDSYGSNDQGRRHTNSITRSPFSTLFPKPSAILRYCPMYCRRSMDTGYGPLVEKALRRRRRAQTASA